MEIRPPPLSPAGWLLDVISSKGAQNGAVISRKRRDIERYAGMDRFLFEIERRGYLAVKNSGQIVIFCNRVPVRPLTRQFQSFGAFS